MTVRQAHGSAGIIDRAYCLLEVKAVEEETRTIRGVATSPAPDRLGDIVDPEGAKFTLPLPLLWQHNSREPIGHVTEAKVTKDGIEIAAQIAQGVTEDIEKAWKLIKAKLVRGLSIGFRSLENEPINPKDPWGAIRFTSWEWLELSAVTIAANAEASITSIKSIDRALLAAAGQERRPLVRLPHPGVSGQLEKKPRPKEAGTMKTIAEQITALEAKRLANTERMGTIMQKSVDEGRSTNAEEQEEFDELSQEVEAIDSDLVRLKAVEKAKAASARPVAAVTTAETGTAARAGVIVRAPPQLAPGIRMARVVRVKALARLRHVDAVQLAEHMYGDDPAVVAVIRAAVAAATTLNPTWAGALVGEESSVFADFVEFLRPQTIVGKFGTNGFPSLRRVPFRVALIGQTSGGLGYWVGEGKAKPLTKFDFERKTLEPLKVANIAVATMEVLRDSSPSAEMIIRDSLVSALRERLDIDFVDPAKAAVANISPASITNGVAGIPSSGNDADAVRADIQALFQAFIAANNPPSSGVWIMSATTALALSLMQNPLGQAEFPGIGMNGGTLFGLPVIVSEYVSGDSAAGYDVILANAGDIYLADEGGFDVDMSQEASLEMSDAPANASDVPTAAQLVSLWQTNSVGFRAERTINWMKRRASAVQLLTAVKWGQPTP